MTEGIEAVTTAALGLALDVASLRHQVISANIANANVVGYAPQSVDFESQLDEARRDLDGGNRLSSSSLSDVIPRLSLALDTNPLGGTPKVMLDVEMAHLAQNGVQYQALVAGLSKHYAILSAAVGDGKK